MLIKKQNNIYYSKEVKGQNNFLNHFCKYVFTFGGYMTFFHQDNKLASNQIFFGVF